MKKILFIAAVASSLTVFSQEKFETNKEGKRI